MSDFVIEIYPQQDTKEQERMHSEIIELFQNGLGIYGNEVNKQHVDNYIQKSIQSDLSNIVETYFTNDKSCFWIAKDKISQKLIGMVGLQYLQQHSQEKDNNENNNGYLVGELRRMSVNLDERKRGIASKLLETLLEFAKEKGFKVIKLSCWVQQIPAINLYKKFGFTMVSDIPRCVNIEKQVYVCDLELKL
ncbi:hypothetical protein ABK040_001073 [Willaertia magna]